MSIRPVDFQVLVPKTQSYSQENQVANNRLRMEQEYLGQQDKTNVEHHLNKVSELEDKDKANIKDKQKEKNREQQNHEKRNKERDEERSKSKMRVRNGIGSNFDMKI